MVTPTDGFVRAGPVQDRGLNLPPEEPLAPRVRHKYGDGPFAKLVMPKLADAPGVYLWELEGIVVYVGQTRTPLSRRLGPMGYSTISRYNTYAREPGRRNGGQQTNCRVNNLANEALSAGKSLVIWYKVTSAEEAKVQEGAWMDRFDKPEWNRRIESSL